MLVLVIYWVLQNSRFLERRFSSQLSEEVISWKLNPMNGKKILGSLILFLRDNSYKQPRNKWNSLGIEPSSWAMICPWSWTQLNLLIYHYTNCLVNCWIYEYIEKHHVAWFKDEIIFILISGNNLDGCYRLKLSLFLLLLLFILQHPVQTFSLGGTAMGIK